MDVRRSGPNVVLRIADDGPGIPPEVADLLFSPGATHGKPQGHGIGLFSARWILEAMGGSLRLERSDATGASFLVTLPLANREA
jgi:signal transduction histidine kinase